MANICRLLHSEVLIPKCNLQLVVQLDGTWEPLFSDESCSPVSCGKPESPEHGFVFGSEYSFESTIVYHCETGYELEVSKQIIQLEFICFCNILRYMFSIVPFCFIDFGPKRFFLCYFFLCYFFFLCYLISKIHTHIKHIYIILRTYIMHTHIQNTLQMYITLYRKYFK